MFLFFLLWLTILLIEFKRWRLASPVSIFLIIWLTSQLLYYFDLFDRYMIFNRTILIINIAIFCYIIGFYLNIFKQGNTNYTFSIHKKMINIRIFIFLAIVAILFLLPTVFPLIIEMVQKREFITGKSDLIAGTSSLGILFVYVVRPLRIFLSIILTIHMNSKRKNYLFIILIMILFILEYIITGSKNIFFTFGIGLIIYLLYLNRKRIRDIFKSGGIVTMGLGFSLVAVLLISSEVNVFEKVYFYLSGNIKFMDYQLSLIDTEYIYKTFGFTTFNGILRIPFIIINFIGLDFYPNILSISDLYLLNLENAINISPTFSYNAFSSMFFYLILDFGYIGMFFASFIFGFLSKRIFANICQKEDYYNTVVYILLIYILINSSAKSILSSPSYGFSVILIIIFRSVLKNRLVNF